MREVIYDPTFSVGNLVELGYDQKERRDLEFMTCGYDEGHVTLWESINLKSFPSSNDFHGRQITVSKGTIAMVLSVVGVPEWVLAYLTIRSDPAPPTHRLIRHELYVYDVLVGGRSFQAFGCDMKLKRSE